MWQRIGIQPTYIKNTYESIRNEKQPNRKKGAEDMSKWFVKEDTLLTCHGEMPVKAKRRYRLFPTGRFGERRPRGCWWCLWAWEADTTAPRTTPVSTEIQYVRPSTRMALPHRHREELPSTYGTAHCCWVHCSINSEITQIFTDGRADN